MKVSTVKVITLTQPWASLVAIGAKKYETRDWQTPYRGPLLIHAAKGLDGLKGVTKNPGITGLYELCTSDPFFETLFVHGAELINGPERPREVFRKPEELPRGRIVAACDLVECIESPGWPPPGCPTDEDAFGNWAKGRFGWELKNIRPTPKIRYRGGQSIRDVDFAKVDDRDYEALEALVRKLQP